MTTIPDVIEGDPVVLHVEPEASAREAAELVSGQVRPAGLYVVEEADQVVERVLAAGELREDAELMVILCQASAAPLARPEAMDELDEGAVGRLRRLPTVAMVSDPDPSAIGELYDRHVNAVVPRPADPKARADVLEQTVAFWRDSVRIPSLAAIAEERW